ncbi:NUDIX hydrolase [Pleionea mediterranea]|uniref:ADP-ribose pyrophosphatase YjhB (NUDIX family) n=1 Tax=Pleionea mediterranea TaxID=523701 RepID=A0A316FNS2_9GAMM|nr:NUDIX domain-containing protein [Pleionea mediterranea]PWK49865.1 ADP-ribose pyrophosphatase YjhB (NUDIX family) [Pleionea mediterranea]
MINTIDTVGVRFKNDTVQILLSRRDKNPYEGEYALPGGWVFEDQDKNLSDAVERVIKTKTNHQLSYYEQVHTIGNSQRDPRDWSVTVVYLCLFSSNPLPENKQDVKWVEVNKILSDEFSLPFDHKDLVALAMERLRSKAMYTTLPGFLCEDVFSMKDYQNVAEQVIGSKLNDRGLRIRLEESNALVDAKMTRQTGKRPAKLFRLADRDKPRNFDRMMYGKAK